MKNPMLVQHLKRERHAALAASAILAWTLTIPSSRAGDGIDAIRIATGFSYPLYVGAPPGDTSRLFVAEQHGLIKVINLPSRTINAKPFFDTSLYSGQGEGRR